MQGGKIMGISILFKSLQANRKVLSQFQINFATVVN
jgi:hypothetical protein